MLKALTTSVIICFFTIAASSQVTQQWVTKYNGPGDTTDYATHIVVDLLGNSYVTGNSTGSGTGLDFATIKYNSAGVQQWAARYNGPVNGFLSIDKSFSIGIDLSGNIYVTGLSARDSTNTDMTTIKYNNNGVQQWVVRYPGTGASSFGCSLAVDPAGNVFAVGSYNNSRAVTIKYNTNGVQQWAASYNTNNVPPSDNERKYIKLDNQGNVIVTGASSGNATGNDIFVVKYNNAGVQLWSTVYNDPFSNSRDIPEALNVDHQGNIYVAGLSDTSYAVGGDSRFVILKLNQSGVLEWNRTPFNDLSNALGIAFDSYNNVYVAGDHYTSLTEADAALLKYSPSGNLIWLKTFTVPNTTTIGSAVVSDYLNNLYVSGYYFGGPGGRITLKYNSAGALLWSQDHRNTAFEYFDDKADVAVDRFRNVYSTGGNTGEPNDYVTIKYSQDCVTIAGQVTYKDNNMPVNPGGFAKAFYYDTVLSYLVTVDSTTIQTNGMYALSHCPPSVELYIMVYQNDDQLDYVPTYYPSTIDWQQAVQVITPQNINNINVQVDRITNVTSPFSISGTTLNSGASVMIDNAVVYVKSGSLYKNYGISGSNGAYVADKLPAGSYTLTAYRIGYNSVSQNITVVNGNVNSVNFDFGNPIGIININTNVPSGYRLYQNYPNPFNPETKIRYDVLKNSKIAVKIYDILGRVVAEPVNAVQNAGTYEISFNAASFASGVYFYRLSADGVTVDTKKMILTK